MTVVTILRRIYRTEPRRLSQLVGHDWARWRDGTKRVQKPPTLYIYRYILQIIYI